jgi:hypothetical protein
MFPDFVLRKTIFREYSVYALGDLCNYVLTTFLALIPCNLCPLLCATSMLAPLVQSLFLRPCTVRRLDNHCPLHR